MTHDTQRIRPADGDLSTHDAYQRRYGWREVKPMSEADATERRCGWILCWVVVIGTFAAAGLITLGGCR